MFGLVFQLLSEFFFATLQYPVPIFVILILLLLCLYYILYNFPTALEYSILFFPLSFIFSSLLVCALYLDISSCLTVFFLRHVQWTKEFIKDIVHFCGVFDFLNFHLSAHMFTLPICLCIISSFLFFSVFFLPLFFCFFSQVPKWVYWWSLPKLRNGQLLQYVHSLSVSAWIGACSVGAAFLLPHFPSDST